MRTKWRGSKNVCFCPRSGYKIKIWQNSVHVVVEGPLRESIDDSGTIGGFEIFGSEIVWV